MQKQVEMFFKLLKKGCHSDEGVILIRQLAEKDLIGSGESFQESVPFRETGAAILPFWDMLHTKTRHYRLLHGN